MDRIRVQCQECGGVSTVLIDTMMPKQVLNCPRCRALTYRWNAFGGIRVKTAKLPLPPEMA